MQTVLRPVAEKFCIPLIIGRGQCSTRPLYNIAQRYKASGKEKLIILAVSDLDPDGDAIAHSLGQRLRDDFHVGNVEVIKCALTMEQVRSLKLPKKYERAKAKSANRDRYVRAYLTDFVWEVEALDPKVLQRLLTAAIDGVIDRRAFNADVAQERADAAHNARPENSAAKVVHEQLFVSRRHKNKRSRECVTRGRSLLLQFVCGALFHSAAACRAARRAGRGTFNPVRNQT